MGSQDGSSNVRTGGPTRVVVVGNGMVGYKLCETLVELDRGERFQVVVLGEEPRPAYDRVQLTAYFGHRSADALTLAPAEWYREHGIDLRLGACATSIDRAAKRVVLKDGSSVEYDHLVLATGSAAFVPPVPGVTLEGVFVYRTIEDLEGIIAWAGRSKRCAVLGGGLLGLEAARAVRELGLETSVIELAPRLMPRQLDGSGARLLEREIRALDVDVLLNCSTERIEGEGKVEALLLSDGRRLEVDMVVVSAGIRPRDELAKGAGIALGPRGGVLVDDALLTSDPDISAIGEVALHEGMIYGLVAPGYQMADAVARRLVGETATFTGSDMSAKLKLMGVDVASVGDPLREGPDVQTIVYQDHVKRVYKKLVLSSEGKLSGAILVGDASEYARLVHVFRTAEALGEDPESLILGARGGATGPVELPDSMQVCSCNNVSKGQICERIREGGLTVIDEVKKCTKAGTSCGGCLPTVSDILAAELAKAGRGVKPRICEHFDFTRTDLYEIVRVTGIRTFEDLIAKHGTGYGCEVCKPAVASILASVHNDMILDHASLQDTNDRFLANIQRQGLYSVVPRIPGGEITPEKLIAIGEVAKKFGLYTKITGGQRIDLFGARVNDLPDIWEMLVDAGFESGHAYGKALRTVKSCVGSTWCRYGVQDSVGFAIAVEERYKGLRAPHKLKSAVSGCVRECAEAQSKDFGIIATEKGWNLYVCGNGGAKPRHADLLASDIDSETCVKYIDRFLMYYVKTADRLTRTSVWLDKLEGGIERLRDVVVNDCLGIGEELERQMQHIVDTFQCEWTTVVRDPERRKAFRHYANSEVGDDTVVFIGERSQRRPADWPKADPAAEGKRRVSLPIVSTRWTDVGAVEDVPRDGGIAVKHGNVQLAVFHFAARGEWFATQNMCPHKQDMVLARGILGDVAGTPKVACPLHKKTFSLESGECLSGDDFRIATFPVRIEAGRVLVDLPPAESLEASLCKGDHECDEHRSASAADAAE